MHEAYSVLPPGKINSQIECLAGYDNFVFLGNRVGHLSQYSVQPRDGEGPDEEKVLQLLQYDKNFSKKNIIQLEIVPECRLLFCLSGERQLSIHNISEHSFPLVYTEPKTRGASLFALSVVRQTSSTMETAIIIRLCVLVKRRLQFYFFKRDSLAEGIKDIELQDVPKTMNWMNESLCLGFDSDYVIYLLDREVPLKIKLFPPSSAKSIHPYISTVAEEVFALAKDEYTFLVDPKSQVTATQDENVMGTGMSPKHQQGSRSNVLISGTGGAEISKYHKKAIRWSQPLKAFVWDDPFAVGLMQDSVEIRTLDNSVEPIQVIKDLPGVRYLIRTGSGLLFAASVSQLWQINLRDIPTQIQELNETKNFNLSLKLIEKSPEDEEAKAEERKRVQTLLAHDLFENKKFEEAMDVFIARGMNPCYVIKMFPNFQGKEKSSPVPLLDDHEVEKALLALQYFLAAVRPKVKNLFDSGVTQPECHGKTPAAMLSIIDTTMLKCYLQTKESLVAPLLRLNHCHLEESEKLLKKYQKHRELIILYQTKKQHRLALDMLKSMDESSSGLNGLQETIRYLQKLGSEHTQLICEFSDWVLAKDPEEGLKIFTEDTETVEELSRGVVLDFLLKNHKNVVIPYLRHIIEVWGDEKQMFHNILVKMYQERIWEVYLKQGKESSEGKELRQKLFKFLKESKNYSPEAVLRDFPTNDFFEERAVVLSRSGQHKKALQIFVQALGDFEMALDYCKEHYQEPNQLSGTAAGAEAASEVYFYLIELLMAENKTPFEDVPLHKNCLDKELVDKQVFSILDHHGAKVSAQKVIEILPDDIPLSKLSRFLETALRHQQEQRRRTQILKAMLHVDQLQVQEERIKCESKSVVITDSSLCHMCQKRFNSGGAFVRYPRGDVVHFSCQQKYKL